MVPPILSVSTTMPPAEAGPGPRLHDLPTFRPSPGIVEPDVQGDEALLAHLVLHDPAFRRKLRQEIERRPAADTGAAARLERLRDLRGGLEVVAPEAAGAAFPELAKRVLQASRLVRARGLARLRLDLETAALGEIRLDLTLRGGALHATFRAADPGAAEALRAGLPELRRALEERGLAVADLAVAEAEPAAERPAGRPPAGGPGRLDRRA